MASDRQFDLFGHLVIDMPDVLDESRAVEGADMVHFDNRILSEAIQRVFRKQNVVLVHLPDFAGDRDTGDKL